MYIIAVPDKPTQDLVANMVAEYQELQQELGTTLTGALILGMMHELGTAGAILMNPDGTKEDVNKALQTMAVMGMIAIRHLTK